MHKDTTIGTCTSMVLLTVKSWVWWKLHTGWVRSGI